MKSCIAQFSNRESIIRNMASSSVPGKFEDEAGAAGPVKSVKYVRHQGFTLPPYFSDFDKRIRKMDVRDDDIWLFGVPKSSEL